MKLILENWRKYLNEEPAAFHGAGMSPVQMRVDSCDFEEWDEEHGYADEQWETGEKGCPQFSNDMGISSDHPDIQQAIEFLDNVKPSRLIAFSRGGAIAFAALERSNHSPPVTFVAPAWKRGWVSDLSPVEWLYDRGVIIHGTADDKVPLAHSAELSLATGMDLYVFDGLGHVNILKHKFDPTSGRLFSQEEKEELINRENETSV